MRGGGVTYAIIGATAAFGAAQPSSAQRPASDVFQEHVLTLTAAFGGAAFSDFHQGFARSVEARGAGPGSTFSRRLSAQTTVAFSASVAYWISRSWGLRIHASYSPSRFRVIEGPEAREPVTVSDEPPASLAIRMYDVNALYRPGLLLGRVAPYALAGAGRVDYRVRGDAEHIPFEARSAFASGGNARWAAVLGIGAVIPLERNDLQLSFEFTNHLARTPLRAPPANAIDAAAPSVRLNPDGTETAAGLTSHLRLSVGFSVPIGLSGNPPPRLLEISR